MTKTARRRWREHLPTIAQNYADAFEEFERVRRENAELRAMMTPTPGNRYNPQVPSRALGWQYRALGDAFEVYGDDRNGDRVTVAMVGRQADAHEICTLRDTVEQLRRRVAQMEQERDE